MRLSPKTLFAIFLCAATLALPTTTAAQKARAKTNAPAKAQAPAAHTEITKEKIEAIISALEAAAKKKEFSAITAYLAPDFKYKSGGGDRPLREANRAEYAEMLKLVTLVTLDYTYMRKSLTITIAPDGQSATAHIEAFEMVTLEKGTLAGHTTSFDTFKIYKGKILISAMEASMIYV
ncbi:MAG TPA: hypothetical protein VGW12_11005 [Pyrinomonadaceae bacterium]|nr:hypothetical protein [Pyrinomonadaceae bacterium]